MVIYNFFRIVIDVDEMRLVDKFQSKRTVISRPEITDFGTS